MCTVKLRAILYAYKFIRWQLGFEQINMTISWNGVESTIIWKDEMALGFCGL